MRLAPGMPGIDADADAAGAGAAAGAGWAADAARVGPAPAWVAVVPGIAARASSACWSDTAVASAVFCRWAADGLLDFAALDLAVLALPELEFPVAAVVAAGRLPLLTKPSTPCEASEPE
ncbi:MAG TPA: hypothetical protein VG268_23270 [Streptosporangiaceae bacterium]|nr:hypothetical protein [Streptosporangiaceae bacterium]